MYNHEEYSASELNYILNIDNKKIFSTKNNPMNITWNNYKAILPESLWEKFIRYAHQARGRAIIYTAGGIRYANIDEY